MAPLAIAWWSSFSAVSCASTLSGPTVLARPSSQQRKVFALDCERYLVGEASSSIDKLEELCRRHGFSDRTCEDTFATLDGGPFSRQDAKPTCEKLESSEESGNVIAALQHRQGRTGASLAESHTHFEKAVSGKKGQPDYLVGSDDPPLYEIPPSPIAHPPPTPTDLTIAQPPDADGNFFTDPEWGVNGEPTLAAAAQAEAPGDTEVVEDTNAETQAPVAAEAEQPVEAEVPVDDETAEEANLPNEIEADEEAEESAETDTALDTNADAEAVTEDEAEEQAEAEALVNVESSEEVEGEESVEAEVVADANAETQAVAEEPVEAEVPVDAERQEEVDVPNEIEADTEVEASAETDEASAEVPADVEVQEQIEEPVVEPAEVEESASSEAEAEISVDSGN